MKLLLKGDQNKARKQRATQRMIADAPFRFRVAVCGRRFGKTHLAIRELAKYASQPDQRVWYVAPTYRMAKQIVWKKLKKKLLSINWVKKVNEQDLTLELVNGSEISLRGADNYDSLRGVGLNFIVLDEAADIDEEAWREVLRPTLADTGGHALFLGTPKGMNWFKDIYDNHTRLSNWVSFQFTTVDGGNVPEEEVRQAREDLDARTFSQEFLATFQNFSGIIAYAFGEHNIKSAEELTAYEPLILGTDFNVSPMSCCVMRRTKDGLHCVDEIVLNSSNTNELVDEIRNRYPTNPIQIFPDPSGVQRKTSANGNTDIKILENAGFTVRYHRQHPAVKDRINAANSLFFKREDSTTRFYIDPKCKHTIKSLQQFCYKLDSQIPDKDSGFDHMFDALTYAIQFLFPINKETQPVAPRAFGHALA
jgi:phage terminase large subunit